MKHCGISVTNPKHPKNLKNPENPRTQEPKNPYYLNPLTTNKSVNNRE